MKKQILAALLISISTACVFFTSCKDDDEKSCSCTEFDTETGYSASQTLDPSSYGATNCSDLAVKLNMQMYNSEYYYSCN